jgi:hypothetical protein
MSFVLASLVAATAVANVFSLAFLATTVYAKGKGKGKVKNKDKDKYNNTISKSIFLSCF